MARPLPVAALQAPNAWRVLALLLGALLVNVYDRVLPAVLAEPLRVDFALRDVQLGILGAAFTFTFAAAGVPLGVLADRLSRRKLLAAGLAVWSGFTALGAAATGFGTFLVSRVGVGIGEASLGPLATSLLGDLFPAERRSRAIGLYMLGVPLGMVLGFATVGALARAFGSWRAAFLVASLPGLALAAGSRLIREPARGASEVGGAGQEGTVARPLRTIARIPAFWWIVLSGAGYNFAAYGAVTFLVPLLQRSYHLPLATAGAWSAVLVGGTGLLALGLGGFVADLVQRRARHGRLLLATACLALGAGLIWQGLRSPSAAGFAPWFGAGYLLSYVYVPAIYPVLQALVVPQLRATVVGLYFAATYLLGGAFGTVAVGALSDRWAERARLAEAAPAIAEAHRAAGLHGAMALVPLALWVGALGCALAVYASRARGAARP